MKPLRMFAAPRRERESERLTRGLENSRARLDNFECNFDINDKRVAAPGGTIIGLLIESQLNGRHITAPLGRCRGRTAYGREAGVGV